jgi:hypothetical protein
MRRLAVLFTALLLSACNVRDIPPSAIPPICRALVGPIAYNTTNVMSERYAAYLLSLDLHKRNEIGRRLGCPQFK